MLIIKKSDFQLLLAVDSHYKKELLAGVIKALQSLDQNFMTGPEDSGLENVWEEICVQAQFEESVHWSAYEDTMKNYLMDAFRQSPEFVKEVIARIAALRNTNVDGLAMEEWVYDEDLVCEELLECLLSEAEYFSNSRIDAYLTGSDEFEEEDE